MPATDARPHAPAPAAIAGWVVLAIGSVRLALPQREVRQIGLASDLKEPPADRWAVGRYAGKNGPSWPAYSLDENLALRRARSADRRLCVFFGKGEDTRGVLCDHVWSLAADGDIAAEPLPGCMRGPHTPATGLARFENGVALVTEAAALTSYLGLTEAADGGSS